LSLRGHAPEFSRKKGSYVRLQLRLRFRADLQRRQGPRAGSFWFPWTLGVRSLSDKSPLRTRISGRRGILPMLLAGEGIPWHGPALGHPCEVPYDFASRLQVVLNRRLDPPVVRGGELGRFRFLPEHLPTNYPLPQLAAWERVTGLRSDHRGRGSANLSGDLRGQQTEVLEINLRTD